MKSFTLLLFMFSLFFGYGQAQTSLVESEQEPPFIYKRDFKLILDSTQDAATSLYYPKLLKRFRLNDSTLTNREVLALLIGHTISAKYKPLEDVEKEKAFFDLNQEGKYQEVLDKGIPFLKSRVLNLLVLREVSYAYGQQAKYYQKEAQYERAIQCQDSTKFYMDMNDKIMEAMIYSGKGKTPTEPIFSLGLEDGDYFVFNVGFELEKKGTELNKDGHLLEKIVAADRLTAKTFYFVIQHAVNTFDEDGSEKVTTKKSKKTEKKKPEGVVRDSFQIKTYVTQDASGNMITRSDTIQIVDSTQFVFNKSGKSKKKASPTNDSLQIRTFVTYDEEGFPTTKIDTVRIVQIEINDAYGLSKGKKKKGKNEILQHSDSLSIGSDSTMLNNPATDSATMAKDNWVDSKSKKSKKKTDKKEKKTDRVEEVEKPIAQPDSSATPIVSNADSTLQSQDNWVDSKSKKSKKKTDKKEKKTDRVEEVEKPITQADSNATPIVSNADSTLQSQDNWVDSKSKKSKKKSDKKEKKTDRVEEVEKPIAQADSSSTPIVSNADSALQSQGNRIDDSKSKKSKKKTDKKEKKADRVEEGEKAIPQTDSIAAPAVNSPDNAGLLREEAVDSTTKSSKKSTERTSKKREKEKSKNKKSETNPDQTNQSDTTVTPTQNASLGNSESLSEQKQDSMMNPVAPQATMPESQVPAQPTDPATNKPSADANKPQ